MYLHNIEGEVPPYASPALATNYKHLPPTITFVGGMEPFKDETINYVEALRKEGIAVKFEVFEAAFHAFETLVKEAEVSKKANQFQYGAWAEFYDRYLNT